MCFRDLTPVFSCSNIKTMARDVKRRGGSIVTKVGEHNGKYQSFQAHDPAGNAMWMVHKFSRNPLLALHFACVDVAATAGMIRLTTNTALGEAHSSHCLGARTCSMVPPGAAAADVG